MGTKQNLKFGAVVYDVNTGNSLPTSDIDANLTITTLVPDATVISLATKTLVCATGKRALYSRLI